MSNRHSFFESRTVNAQPDSYHAAPPHFPSVRPCTPSARDTERETQELCTKLHKLTPSWDQNRRPASSLRPAQTPKIKLATYIPPNYFFMEVRNLYIDHYIESLSSSKNASPNNAFRRCFATKTCRFRSESEPNRHLSEHVFARLPVPHPSTPRSTPLPLELNSAHTIRSTSHVSPRCRPAR
jgi:hypothetical protein